MTDKTQTPRTHRQSFNAIFAQPTELSPDDKRIQRVVEASFAEDLERELAAARLSLSEGEANYESGYQNGKRHGVIEGRDEVEAYAEALTAPAAELLALYDWRPELAKMEREVGDPSNLSSPERHREVKRLLREYGERKKAGWIALRAALANRRTEIGTKQRQGADSPASASISPSTECLSPAQASSPCLPSDVSLPGAQSAPATNLSHAVVPKWEFRADFVGLNGKAQHLLIRSDDRAVFTEDGADRWQALTDWEDKLVRATLAAAKGCPSQVPKQDRFTEYERNLLGSCSNWLRSRSNTVWAEEFQHSGLMMEYHVGIDRLLAGLTLAPPDLENAQCHPQEPKA